MTRLDNGEPDQFDARLEAAVTRLEQVQSAFGQGQIDRIISTAFRKEERKLRRELNSLMKSALTQSLNELTGGNKGATSLLDSLIGFIPGFARGGVLSRKTRLAHGGEAGPEAVLPLKKGADGRLGVAVHNSPRGQGALPPTPIHITINQPQAPLRRAIDAGDMAAVEAALSREIDHAVDARIRAHQDSAGGFGHASGRVF